MSDNNKIPQLRFPGFSGEWENKKLGEVTIWDKFFQGVPKSLQSRTIKYPYVLANVFNNIAREDGDVLLLSTGNYVGWTTEELAGDNLCEGEIVTIPWGGYANIKYAKGKFVTADNRIATSLDLSVLNNKFLYFTMLSHQSELDSFYRGAGIKHPSMYDVLNMQIYLPSLAEQEKIASFLSEVDAMIEAQGHKVEALKERKRGLMQQLFPQPGETTPDLRFPGFTGKWEEKKLANSATSFSGGTPKSSEPKYYGGTIPFIRSGEIHCTETALFITVEGLNNSSAKLVNKGDLLYALYGATSGDVAISKINGAINQAILCIRSKEIDSCFLCNYLERIKEKITSQYLQGGQGNLSSDIIMSLSIPLPSLDEQEKIASCLSEIDTLIASESAKLETLKEHKRGLMQQLFPQPSK